MEAWAKLIAALGTLLGAIAWPAIILVVAALFRHEIRLAASRLPTLLDRVTKMKIAGIEADLDRVADAVVGDEDSKGGAVTEDQTRTAARIAEKSKDVGVTPILNELDRLCLEYDSIRRAMASGRARTHAMTRVLVKMRSLAPTAADHIDAYRSSGSAGSRLAAVAIMQMVPETADILWLGERFAEEEPFVFYHAALALQNAINHAPRQAEDAIKLVAEQGLETISGFKGEPDQSTIMILQNIMDY